MKQINKDYDNCKFYIFSQNKSHKRGKQDKSIKGNTTAFSDFLETDMDVKLILDDCPFSDFHHITMSDVIIMSKSAFSYVLDCYQMQEYFIIKIFGLNQSQRGKLYNERFR